MALTLIVTRNAAGRTRGFLASCMLEIGPGVYTSPRMNQAVRDRVWSVLENWTDPSRDEGAVMTWWNRSVPGGQTILSIGSPRTELIELDGVFLARRAAPGDEEGLLNEKADEAEPDTSARPVETPVERTDCGAATTAAAPASEPEEPAPPKD